jgi:hypothetical protein
MKEKTERDATFTIEIYLYANYDVGIENHACCCVNS